MNDRGRGAEDDWGTWENNRDRSRVVGLEVTADERIAWVEEMLRVAIASGACPRPRDAWGQALPVDTPQAPRSRI